MDNGLTAFRGSARDPADPAWVWLPHYKQASRRRRNRNFHRHREGGPTKRRRSATRVRVSRPLFAIALTLAMFVTAAAILVD